MRKKRKTKNNKKLAYLGMAGFVLVIAAFIFVASLRTSSSEITGSSVYVRYYGVSDYPMKNRAGKLQTYIELKQPTLKNLAKAEGRKEVASSIVNAANFTQGIVDLYKNAPPAPLPDGALNAVQIGAGSEAGNFKKEGKCLTKIWENYLNRGTFKLVLVSELKYQRCNKDKNWLFAYAQHTFYNRESSYFICSQEGSKLFLVKEKTGKINTNVTAC